MRAQPDSIVTVRHVALAIAALGAAGCGEGLQEPSPINLRVSVSAQGIDHPADGFRILVGGRGITVHANTSVQLSLTSGAYDVQVEVTEANCTLNSDAIVPVVIPPPVAAQTPVAHVVFRVTCQATSGIIELFASSSGRDFPAYLVRVERDNTAAEHLLTANYPLRIPDLASGTYHVSLGPLADNCRANGPLEMDVTIPAGGLTRPVTRAGFDITCDPTTGDLRVTAVSGGSRLDPNGYTFRLDGELVYAYDYYGYVSAPARLVADRSGSSYLLERLAPGSHTVELGDLHSNCRTTEPGAATVAVALGIVTEITFNVVCE